MILEHCVECLSLSETGRRTNWSFNLPSSSEAFICSCISSNVHLEVQQCSPCQLPRSTRGSHCLAADHKKWWCPSLVPPWSAPGPWSWSPVEENLDPLPPDRHCHPLAHLKVHHHHPPTVQACPRLQTRHIHPHSGKAGDPGRCLPWSLDPDLPPGTGK